MFDKDDTAQDNINTNRQFLVMKDPEFTRPRYNTTYMLEEAAK